MAGFKTGLALGVIMTGGAALWALDKEGSEPIRFPTKSVYLASDYISVVGSIVGDEPQESERPVNNMVTMVCRAERMACDFTSINEVSPGYLGLPLTDTLAVRQWNDREMVADSLVAPGADGPCNYYEVRVIFEGEDVTYTRLPNPEADQDRCKEFYGDGKALRQWRIDDGKGSFDYEPGK
ncbi:hypothetical protein G6N82_06835 [Altererythrobacter sp. BO-6]|uniref:hypothetical protein n=1 Tax=Altererythrobacter sp. BO-6 TaxID=2604537 RepID=UPI0013E13794|nr:hypothetical protein [Altererythrobacter sp. BO-6]QIG53907.1 hypothetical protein G6N82_06835 [Altererythrobacter sp. BO-6]